MFRVNTDGSGFTTIHSFSAASDISPINDDGAVPIAGLVLSSNTLYGTASSGGSGANGTVFSVNADGSGFQTLHAFSAFTIPFRTNDDGAAPFGGMALAGNTLYGTTVVGGILGEGTIFSIHTDGSDFRLMDTNGGPGALILSSNTFYETTTFGGSSGNGTVFKVNTDGSVFAILHTFTNGMDGANPHSGLVLSGNTLYGTANAGGASGKGTVFKVNSDGSGFATLHSFTNIDGQSPVGALFLSGSTLYGTTSLGGSLGGGTVFSISTNGSDFTTVHSFAGGSEGVSPVAGLILSGNTLYGTTQAGGSWNNGTVFSLSFTPQLVPVRSGANIVLTWPTNYAGFDYTGYTLQFTTNLGSSAVWTPNYFPPVVVDGQNMVTNPISGTQRFYRLSQWVTPRSQN